MLSLTNPNPNTVKQENANIGIVSLKNAAQIAALLHDVCDHKYISASDNTLAQNNFLNETYDIRTAEVIELIVQSVSYSKEKKGKLDDVLKSMEHSILFLRNVGEALRGAKQRAGSTIFTIVIRLR